MPYDVFHEGKKYKVYKVDGDGKPMGKALGTHDSEEMASRQRRVLYANENKETDEAETKELDDHQKMYDEMKYTPPGVTSFADLDAYHETQELSAAMRDDVDSFGMLASNIMMSDLVEDKATALTALAAEFAGRVQNVETKELDEGDEEKAVWSTAFVNDLPDSSFLYIAPGGKKDEGGKTTPRNLRYFPVKDANGKEDLPHLRNAIARIPQSNAPGLTATKKKQLQDKARKTLTNVQKELDEERWINKAIGKFKEFLGLDSKKQEQETPPSFHIWKEKDGQYHWLARYSNNIRDEDNPPEIIAAKSHKRFVEMVDKGLYPLPELWLWHRPEWKWGQATAVAYDDSGFAIATGTVDKDCGPVAEWAMKQNLATSHGMPRPEVKRDPDDPTIIIEHQTREISPLFDFAAANKRTGFEIMKEAAMPIPTEKREQFIAEGLSREVLDALEAKNKADKKEAADSGLETKEETPATEQKPELPATKEGDSLTLELIAKAIGAAVNPLVERVETLTKEVEALKKDDEAKVKEMTETMPEDSMKVLLEKEMPGLFGEATRIDGRSSLAKAGPKETPPDKKDGKMFFEDWLTQ